MMWMTGILLLASAGASGDAASLDWMEKVYGDGMHNAFTDLIAWHGHYYVCFRHATSHMSMDGEIRVMRSADLKAWEPCGTLDTVGDDRDPHFAATDTALSVYFGTWDTVHQPGHALPDRHSVRSYFATSTDGTQWSKIQGVYEPEWWLWRVRYHDGAYYSAAYTAVRPHPDVRETRLLKSENGLDWTLVSTVTNERKAGEADILWRPDGAVWILSRTGDEAGDAEWFRGDASLQQWHGTATGVLIHAPVFATWKDRCFVAGRGRQDGKYVTRIWELAGSEVREVITLPSGGDTSYPGLLVDPASLDTDRPALFASWYSQHERGQNPNGTKDAASIYVGRIVIR